MQRTYVMADNVWRENDIKTSIYINCCLVVCPSKQLTDTVYMILFCYCLHFYSSRLQRPTEDLSTDPQMNYSNMQQFTQNINNFGEH